MNTFYDILGIAPNASKEDIKKAYRKLSIKFHPDKNDGDAFFSQMFRQVNDAYNTLISDEERRKYDLKLRGHEQSRSHAERLKNLEKELAYKEQLLKEKERDSFLQRQRPQQSKPNMASNSSQDFPIKIKYVKYFLWVVIIGFVIAIGSGKGSNELPAEKSRSTIKKQKKYKPKRKSRRTTKAIESSDTVTTISSVKLDTVVNHMPVEKDQVADTVSLQY